MVRILKFETPGCGQCMMADKVLSKNDIIYDKIDCATAEGEDYASVHNVRHAPVVIVVNDDDKELLRLDNYGDIVKNVEELKKYMYD